MIQKDRNFVIMDFGLARRVDQEEPQLTATGAVLGTPAYMAPEQLRGEKDASGPQSDVYSLGIILYELLTGERPFQGTMPQIYAQVLTAESVTPSLLHSGIDASLDLICKKATNKDASKRFQSAQELASALSKYLDEEPTSASVAIKQSSAKQNEFAVPRQPRLSSIRRRRRPNKLVLLGGAAFFAVFLGVIVIIIRNQDGTTTELKVPNASSVEVHGNDGRLGVVDVPEEARSQGTQSPGTQSPGTQSPGTQSPGTQSPGTQSPGTQSPGTQSPVDQKPGGANNVTDARPRRLSVQDAINLLHPIWTLTFEADDGTQSTIRPTDDSLAGHGKLICIKAEGAQDFPTDYLRDTLIPCIAALPSLTRIEGPGYFIYSEQEFADLASTRFATNGTILSASWVPVTNATADVLTKSFRKVEFISLQTENASDQNMRTIASLHNLQTVWFNCIGPSIGPDGIEAIGTMQLKFAGLYLCRKFTRPELISLANSSTPHLHFWSCDFDNQDLDVFAKQSQAESLSLSSTKVTGDGILALQQMKRLKQAYLGDTPCDNANVQELIRLKPDLTVHWNGGIATGADAAR